MCVCVYVYIYIVVFPRVGGVSGFPKRQTRCIWSPQGALRDLGCVGRVRAGLGGGAGGGHAGMHCASGWSQQKAERGPSHRSHNQSFPEEAPSCRISRDPRGPVGKSWEEKRLGAPAAVGPWTCPRP